MSKTLSAGFITHLAQTTTELATCWRLELASGTEYFFTDHDVDLVVDGDTYEAASGFTASALAQTDSLGSDNAEVTALIESTKITEAMIFGGELDGATLDIFLVVWSDLSLGKLYFGDGWSLGTIRREDQHFVAEIRSLGDKLNQQIVELCSPTCRAIFGDARCTIDLEDSTGTYRYSGSVTTAVNKYLFLDSGVDSRHVDGCFNHGKLVWNTGVNAGREVEIRTFATGGGIFTLFQAMYDTPEIGDTFTAYWGCDKRFETCQNYGNYKNFQGEPDVPGPDEVLDYTTT